MKSSYKQMTQCVQTLPTSDADATSASNASKHGCQKRPVPCDWTDEDGSANLHDSRHSTALTSPLTSSDGSPFLSLLARDHGPLGNLSSSTSFANTLVTLERLVPRLRHRYELELDLIKGQVAERDMAIERLRARLRKSRDDALH